MGASAAALIAERSTFFGEVLVKSLQASEVIFNSVAGAARTQDGCVRFSYVPPGSHVPRRYRCQPDFEIDQEIADAFEVGSSTVHRLRQRLVEEGLDAALLRKPPSTRRPTKLDGAQEAQLIAIACSQAPAGRARWTLQLLADKLVELKVVDSISDETVRQRLKKTNSSRGCAANG